MRSEGEMDQVRSYWFSKRTNKEIDSIGDDLKSSTYVAEWRRRGCRARSCQAGLEQEPMTERRRWRTRPCLRLDAWMHGDVRRREAEAGGGSTTASSQPEDRLINIQWR